MTNDYVYFIENPIKNGQLTLLGETQFGEQGFNMSFVLDGTKDSTKLQIVSYSISNVIKPNSLVYHKNTQTFWIVSHDKVERYTNEDGFVYIHTLKLEGAFELLNARDLTDNGFNQNTYTIEQFVRRLFKLSNFEFDDSDIIINFSSGISGNELIDYVKTYENYTLLSAIRDIFSGYNCIAKMTFGVNSDLQLTNAQLNIYENTGNASREIKTFANTFKDVKEIKTMDKNSYANCVVSNSENVISTLTKTYPTIGGTLLSGTGHTTTSANAVIRLPSPVFKINRIDMFSQLSIRIGFNSNNTHTGTIVIQNVSCDDDNNLKRKLLEAIDKMRNNTYSAGTQLSNQIDDFENKVLNQFDLIKAEFENMAKVSFYNDVSYNPINNNFSSPSGLVEFNVEESGGTVQKAVVLVDKETRDCLQNPDQGIYYERGSNLIRSFGFFTALSQYGDGKVRINKTAKTIFYETKQDLYSIYSISVLIGNFDAYGNGSPTINYSMTDSTFRVEYIPMTDIKIKLDNNAIGRNIQLYNQNGKLTDAYALSRLINSYKTEVESDNITKYTMGYDFNSMPQVGDIVLNENNDRYVINNVSLDFYENEENESMGYYIVGEYTLSKNVATKSLMTNPNTNIRDYGIPQNYNVKRKQLYRDFYEFGFSVDPNADTNYYLPIQKIICVEPTPQNLIEHNAIIKTIASDGTYYYQLATTSYLMKKSYYEIVDFLDNNIIGYGSQNKNTGFEISRPFDPTIKIINTPISYVDTNGQLVEIDIAFCTNDQITDIWQDYKETTAYSTNDTISLYNCSIIIPQQIYEGSSGNYQGAKDNCDFLIQETTYNKDALEVPVFEYCCQLDDTTEVEVGENILINTGGLFIVYAATIRNLNSTTQINAHNYFKTPEFAWDTLTDSNYTYLFEISDTIAVVMSFDDNQTLRIKFYAYYTATVYSNDDNSSNYFDNIVYGSQISKSQLIGKDIVIYKDVIKSVLYDSVEEEVVSDYSADLMFLIHGATNDNFDGDDLIIKINHYRLN